MNSNAPTRIARTAAARTVLLWGACGCLCVCAAAQAQPVRKCQVDGRLVYQASPCATEARVASAPPRVLLALPATAVDPFAGPKKKTLADLLRERDGTGSGRAPTHEAQGDGANVLRSRMGAV